MTRRARPAVPVTDRDRVRQSPDPAEGEIAARDAAGPAMPGRERGRRRIAKRGRLVGTLVLLALVGLGVMVGIAVAGGRGGVPDGTGSGTGGNNGGPGPVASTSSPGVGPASPPATPATPSPAPTPTPSPTPVLVPAPLDGLLVSPEQAARHPIAVMVDDLGPARPQAGFGAASVVWQAPAEGGIPRYMIVFGAGSPSLVGPVRSARYYFIAWAAEWRAMYVHAGGSPQALATLRAQGHGQLVYDADQFRYGRYLWRVRTRASPHNLYTDGARLDELAGVVGATAPPGGPVWQFGPDAPPAARPVGGRIEVAYPANRIRYDYDRVSNRYLRSVTGEGPQVDAATGERVAPKNVVIITMRFGPLDDGRAQKGRLEAQVVGSGTAWIATNGRTIVGRWRKESLTGPTRFFDRAGRPVTLTAGQTFVQVVPLGTPVTIVPGIEPGTAGPPPGAFSPD